MIALDFSKAFDRLCHQSFLQTLTLRGLPLNFLKWLSNFLQNRTQKVLLNGALSNNTVSVTSGVPQGSILAPYLFATHIGTLKSQFLATKMIKYADDITLLIPYEKNSNVEYVAKKEMENVTQ